MIQPRDLPLLPVFVAVANAGSFTGAARQLRLGKSVVSEHIRTLEERVGVRLIERSTRRLRLTQIGAQVLDAANEVLGAVRDLEQVVEGHKAAPTGTLRVTLPYDPALSALLAPIAASLTRKHPSLTVDLLFDDGVRDLLADGLDVALRLGAVAESSYVVRRLGAEPGIIVANDTVLADYRDVEEPQALRNAPWVVHSGLHLRSTLAFRSATARGDKQQISVDVRATTNTGLAVRNLLMAGVGFGVLPLHMVRDDLKNGRLTRVCPAWFHRRLMLHALLPTRQPAPRVRAFLNALGPALKPLGFDAP